MVFEWGELRRGAACFARGLLPATHEAMALYASEATPDAFGRGARLERELEALLTNGTDRADGLRGAGVGLGSREEHIGVGVGASSVVEPVCARRNKLRSSHSGGFNDPSRPGIPGNPGPDNP